MHKLKPETAEQLLPVLNFANPEHDHGGMVLEELTNNSSCDLPLPFKMSRFSLEPGESSPFDEHSVCECWFVASGSGTLTYNGDETVKIEAGTTLFYDSHKSHTVVNDGSETLFIFAIWWSK
jgi:mannose-6-phosphate isomerase-like protein (cupin superfamily)